MNTAAHGKFILDACCGSRMFWFEPDNQLVLFGDIRTEEHFIKNEKTLVVHPDIEIDFRDMPFSDMQFKLVVFDPPHLNRCGATSILGKKYGVLGQHWKNDLKLGFSECFRVLEDYGVLIFKWSEIQIPLSSVLKLTVHRPLFGNRSGKNLKTHWVCFMKIPSPHAKS